MRDLTGRAGAVAADADCVSGREAAGCRLAACAGLLLFSCRSRPAVEIPLEALAAQDAVCAELAAAVDDTVPAVVPADVRPPRDDPRYQPPPLRLTLNIPAYRLDVYVGD